MDNYFVSYSWSKGGQVGTGCISVKAKNGIRNFDDIKNVIAAIEKDYPGLGDVVIINWQRFEEEEDNG